MFILLFLSATGFAQGIKGGWISYRYVFTRDDTHQAAYAVGVYLYNPYSPYSKVYLNFWDASNGNNIMEDSLRFYPAGTTSNHFSQCPNTDSLNNKYAIVYAETLMLLPPFSPLSSSSNGYLVTATTKVGEYLDKNIVNIYFPHQTGMLLTTSIPGTMNGIDLLHTNANPVIAFTDTVSACKGQPFSLPCMATDADGDSLSYSFGDAAIATYNSGPPPRIPVNYSSIYSGAEPMGSGVAIDPVTGIISGTAPDLAGGYVITVYVQEWRNGVLINTTPKESVVQVNDCLFQKPLLKPLYSSCRVNRFTFTNEPTCPDITSYFWDFGDTTTLADTSRLPSPSYTYPGPGTYKLKLVVANNDGYLDSATSVVKIFGSISISLRSDTAICSTDIITLRPVSDAVNYVWRESGGGRTLSSYTIKTPKATPLVTTTYFVNASLDGCRDSAGITVHASPYPRANAGTDTVICIGNRATLHGRISGAYFAWSPTSSLEDGNTLQPISFPQKTTAYILTARDTPYCPKTVSDTVVVKVVPAFRVDAGVDASIVAGEPYRLNAVAIDNTEMVDYAWQPARYLNKNNVPNPIATISPGTLGPVRFTVTATTVVAGCTASDDVVLTIYKIGPDIVIPTAFTPNCDGRNDVLVPTLIGISRFDYFRVYNRFGQLVFATSSPSTGWDGATNGEPQPGGVYVVSAHGIDYLGKTVLKKQTVVLMR